MSHKKIDFSNDLGYQRPVNHKEKSKQQILQLIKAEEISNKKTVKSYVWKTLSGIAASLVLFFFLTQNNGVAITEKPIVEEDVFVTSLLMDTLLLEEVELDQAIQDALLDDFENDLVMN